MKDELTTSANANWKSADRASFSFFTCKKEMDENISTRELYVS